MIQTVNLASQVDTTRYLNANLRIASNSSLIYPGIFSSIDFPLQATEVSGIRKDGSLKTIMKTGYISLGLGYYHHPGFHDNIYLLPEWILKRSNSSSWFTVFIAGIGYSRTFLGGTTYQVDKNGNASIIPLAGYNYILGSLGYGAGYDFSKKFKKSISAYSRLNLLVMFPYNSTFYPRPTLEFGIIYSPRQLFGHNIRIFNVNKEVKNE